MDYDDELRHDCEVTGDPLRPDGAEDIIDDFEAEMEAELDDIVSDASKTWAADISNSNPVPSTSAIQLASQTHYDKEYFDSSDEEESTRDRKKLTNDELLYNPDADEDDEKWMAKQARKYEKAKTSDAVLNCPACMTVLCVDCQRHTTYQHQYRAMFTMNCTVDSENVLKYKKKTTKKRGRKKKSEKEKARRRSRSKSLNRASDATDSEAEDLYHPVKCNVCGTEVGVFDHDEVVHFFNVIASH